MTLCFSQEQAAAVYTATKGAKKGNVFISPFVGRLDDIGENGVDLIANIVKMYKEGDGHVEVLTASVRNLNHFLTAIKLGAEIITAPLKVLKEWKNSYCEPAKSTGEAISNNLRPIIYQKINLTKPWTDFDISHPLTDKGLERFVKDWENVII
jgi:transaldolase